MNIEVLFPGFKYFGDSAFDSIWIDVPSDAKGIRVSLSSLQAEILNLSGIRAYSSTGARIDLASCRSSVSSAYNDDDSRFGAKSLQSGGGVHTKRERGAWAEMLWGDLDVAKVNILNRPDEYGVRSDSIVVELLGKNGAYEAVYVNGDVQSVLPNLSKVARYVPEKDFSMLMASERYSELNSVCKRHVIDSIIENQGVSIREMDWVSILLDVRGGNDRLDGEVISIYFSSVIANGGSINGLGMARNILSTKAGLERSEGIVNQILSDADIPSGFYYTRHGLVRSQLKSFSRDYAELAHAIGEVLEVSGFQSMICYGTLLGATRDGDLIPHDDDFDMLFFGGADSKGIMVEDRARAIEILRDAGFRIVEIKPLLNFHVSLPNSNIVVDVFPSWCDVDGNFFMYMEGMKFRSVPKDLIFPRNSIEFLGKNFFVPANPEGFLLERYGEGWVISDRFFEWPYPVS